MGDEGGEEGVATEERGIADEVEAGHGTGHGDVEFAVDDDTVLNEAVVGEEVKLVGTLDGEAIDDDFTLGTLETFDGVDGWSPLRLPA